ncbi:MCH2 [Cyberlindnera jadinii]|uniref:MCH2 protein n=1 Tax=Cyberlindnera jadinii (strain ATCC 18201 / CBS 1600 / BCRC 20928 / JCM 3617 / NBRC 0987 / NRRL Y-1542) TaxID=983966 RepID=A0A0H5BY54_CYBJN|nr:MCH2 [Cyberlindnera jadinii]
MSKSGDESLGPVVSSSINEPEKVDGLDEKVVMVDEPLSTDNVNTSAVIDVPEGGYGWFVVMGVFFFNFATWAANSGYSIYLANYLSNNKFKGASKLDYAAVGGLAFGSGMILGPLVRIVLKHTTVKLTITIGACLQFLGTILAAFSTQLWQIYLTQGVLIGIGMGMICIPATTLIAQWFRHRRSLAQAIASAASGVGGVVFNLSVQAMIKNLSLRWALIIQSIMCAVCNTIGIILVKPRTKHINTSMKIWDNHMLTFTTYWLFLLYIATTQLGYVVLLYNMADFTISLGYSARQGSIVACMISAGAVFGRPLVGRLSDKFGPVTTSIFAHSIVGILCLAMWIPARNYATAIAFAFLEGSLMGSIWVVIASIAVRVVGLRKLDVAMSMAWLVIGSFGLVSPIIGIELRGTTPDGSLYHPTQYRDPAIYCGVCFLASAFVLWVLRGYLIARDRKAKEIGSHVDNEELTLPVSLQTALKGMVSVSEERHV